MAAMLRYVSCLLPVCLMLISFVGRPAYAHYLWVIEHDDQYAVARGTLPDDLETYQPNAVSLIKVFDNTGKEVPVERVNEKGGVVFRPERAPSIASVMCDWGSRVKTTRGKKLMTRKEAEGEGFKVLEAFVSTQTSKTLFRDGTAVCKPLGMKFEIVPLKSPFQLKHGDLLEVQIYFDGSPLKDAVVSSGGNPQTKTDQKGMARIDALRAGWNVVMARHTVSVAGDPDINYHQFMTFLVFKVQ